MYSKLLTTVAAIVFVAGSTAAFAAAYPSADGARAAVYLADPHRLLIAIGDTHHLHDDGPPGQNLDGENGRPGNHNGDTVHSEADGAPGQGNDFPGYGGNK